MPVFKSAQDLKVADEKAAKGDTYLTRLCIILPIHPPLLLHLQIFLKIQQKIGRRHSPTRKEMFRHPSILEIIRCSFMREYVDKQLSARFEGSAYFGKKEFIILHVFEELDGEDAIVCQGLELVIDDIASYDFEVG